MSGDGSELPQGGCRFAHDGGKVPESRKVLGVGSFGSARESLPDTNCLVGGPRYQNSEWRYDQKALYKVGMG